MEMVQDSRVPHKFRDSTGRHEITLLGSIYTPQMTLKRQKGLVSREQNVKHLPTQACLTDLQGSRPPGPSSAQLAETTRV